MAGRILSSTFVVAAIGAFAFLLMLLDQLRDANIVAAHL